MPTDTKQLTADEVLERLKAIREFSEEHMEPWKNEVARDLKYLAGHACVVLQVDSVRMSPEFGAAVLRIVERVAEFEEIDRVEKKEPPVVWQENTRENPFWTDSETYHGGPVKAVEVMFKDGKTSILRCPKCSSRSFDQVVKWRKIEAKGKPNE